MESETAEDRSSWDKLNQERDTEVTQVKDADGNSIDLINYKGVPFAAFPGLIPRLKKLPTLKARDDDVVLLAYPKSGTHWTWEILTMLYRKKADTIKGEKIEQFLEFADQEVLEAQSSPRILNTHVLPSMYPPDLIKKRSKIVFILRNPKDAMVSFYHHTLNLEAVYHYAGGKWSAYFELFMAGKVESGSWFDYILAWEEFFQQHPDIPVLTLYYEDMKQNLNEEVKKIAAFAGVSVDEDLCEDIAKACTFERMKTEKIRLYPEAYLSVWADKEYRMYRKGKTGDWKNWFTVAQNERFHAEYEKRMKESKISIRWK